MESIKQSINDLTEHFNTRMAEFQQSLQGSIPATSPTSNIAAQFSVFRSFVLSALEALQRQVELISKQMDHMEMRSRRKMLLIHGITEDKNENISAAVAKVFCDHLKIPEFTVDELSRCQRLGQSKQDKPRVILLEFRDISVRDRIWFGKTSLKNTGVTLSEFLTKDRHNAFMTARQKFGISNCWTRDGSIFVNSPDGKRHRVLTTAEVNSIYEKLEKAPVATTSSVTVNTVSASPGTKTNKVAQNTRSKRIVKK